MANNEKNQPKEQNPTDRAPVMLEVAGLLNDDASDNPVMVLKDKKSERVLLMWIGDVEAQAIDLAIQKYTKQIKVNRPLMQDLFLSLLGVSNAKLAYVIIDRLKSGTYYASIAVQTAEGTKLIDARPSDAVVIAIEARCPLLADRSLFEKASSVLQPENIISKPAAKNLEINISFLPAAPEDQGEFEEDEAEILKNTILPPHEHGSLDAQLTPEDLVRIRKQISEAQIREQNTQL